MSRRDGSLMVCGCGIRAPAHVTTEALLHIERAERVFSLVADPLAEAWLASVNARTESLSHLYRPDTSREETYDAMIARIVGCVSAGFRVCAVAYGHPGVYAYPLHESVRKVRESGRDALMLPGISAEDCLFAELGIDPGRTGACSFEATDFLIYNRHADTTATVILWQVGVIGERSHKSTFAVWNIDGIHALVDRLLLSYPRDHEVIVYEAARFVTSRSIVARTPLHDLAGAPITALSTVVIPPAAKPVVDAVLYRRLTKSSA